MCGDFKSKYQTVKITKKEKIRYFNIYLKQLALTGTVFFSMLPTTAEVLQRVPPNNPFASSIEDPLVQNFYMSYVVIFGIFAIYQIIKISKGEMNEI